MSATEKVVNDLNVSKIVLCDLKMLTPEMCVKIGQAINGAIDLLKEQKAIPVDTKVIGTFNGDMEVYCCRDCRTILDPAFHYCPNCGQEVKWE